MNLIVKIAWRNIMRHRGKSIIIGVILFKGALLMTIGNGIISGMDHGLHKNIVSSFSGDIVLVSQKQESDNVFIEFMGKAVEPINNFLEIEKIIDTLHFIDKYVPIGKNAVMVLNDEGGKPGYTFIIGADLKRYYSVFPNTMVPIEGRLIKDNEKGVIVPTGARQEMFDNTGIWFKPENESLNTKSLPHKDGINSDLIITKDSIVLMGFNNDNTTYDIRLGVKGIVKYKALNQILGNFTLMDIESYRTCLGYFSSQDKATSLSSDDKRLLELDDNNLDALFSDISDNSTITNNNIASDISNEAKSDNSFASVLPQTEASPDIDAGTYNLVLLRLKNSRQLNSSIATLNNIFKENNLDTRAITWKKAMGMIGSTAVIIKCALFTFVTFLLFVAVIIIVNTLSMAALERTTEIGMMRAVGARKNFIRFMFLGETGILSFLFGGAGIIAGLTVIKIIGLFHITTNNDMIQLLFGGDTFSPLITIPDIILSIIQLSLVTFIAVLYPMKLASSITPLDAISRE